METIFDALYAHPGSVYAEDEHGYWNKIDMAIQRHALWVRVADQNCAAWVMGDWFIPQQWEVRA